MTELEIITGNDAICQMIWWESIKVYVYQVPNLFPHNEDSGWTEFNVQDIGFHNDWNMLIGAYNKALHILMKFKQLQTELLNDDKNIVVKFGIQNFFGPLLPLTPESLPN